jgi:tetratricopeptide (TPR) repeat protein
MDGRIMPAAVLAAILGFAATPAPVFAQQNGGAAKAEAPQPLASAERASELFKQGKYAEALAVAEQLAKSKEGDEAVAGELINISWYALFANRFERALEAGDRAAALDPESLSAQTNRAHALMLLGRDREALALYVAHKGENSSGSSKWEEVIASDFDELQKHSLSHPLMAQAAKAMADAPESKSPRVLLQHGLDLIKEKKHSDALPLLESYREAVRTSRGEDSLAYAKALLELVKLFQDIRQPEKLESTLLQALTVHEKIYGADHHNIAVILNKLGMFYYSQGRYGDAEPLFKRALDVRERGLGKDHPNTLTSVSNLGALYSAQGRDGETEPLYKRVLEIRERTLGKEHLDTLLSVNNLAELYSSQGRYGEAESLHKRALEAYERVLGKDHPDTLTSVSNLAELYSSQGRYGEAETLHKRALEARERILGKDHPDTLTSVNNLAGLYKAQGRYGEAESLHKRALEARERILGKDHPDILTSVNNLAGVYESQGRYGEAEALYKRALEVKERTLGKDHPSTLISVNNLAVLYASQGRHREAEPLCTRVLEARERISGKDHPDTLTGVNNLAVLYESQGRYGEAEALYKRALEVRERILGKDHPDTLTSVGNLAGLYVYQGRYGESEPLYQRALEAKERVLGKDHPDTLSSASNLAELYDSQGRHREAELLCKRALEGRERGLGKDHPDTLTSVNNLAFLYYSQERHGEAEPLYKRVLEGVERSLGKDHPNTLSSVNNLAALYDSQGRYGEAEPLYRRALEGRERVLGKDHPDTLTSVNNLAFLYYSQERHGEAEPLYKRAIEGAERVLGKDHPFVLTGLNNLATLYVSRGRYAEAGSLHKRALEARERTLGGDHPDTLQSVSNLGVLHFEQGDWSRAVDFWRRSLDGVIRRTLKSARDSSQDLTGAKKSEAERKRGQFKGLVKAAYRLAPEGAAPEPGLIREMFQSAQWAAGSDAAQSLAQMIARGAAGDPKLAAAVRERQDLAAEWRKREDTRNAALGKPTEKRDARGEAEALSRIAEIEARVGEIDKALAKDFPDYAALVSPAPLSVEEVQAKLEADEALALFLDTAEKKPTPEETFIWVVTKTEARWVRSELGTEALKREVAALRCGLDSSSWREGRGLARQDDKNQTARNRCAELLGKTASENDLPPFDLARAHALYRSLFGQVEDLIKGKRLLIAPSGPLTRLPFQVLVTEAPDAAPDAYAKAKWLGARNAIAVLPSVASLRLLRNGKQASASDPFLGFGDPLLTGQDGKDTSAWSKQDCGKAAAPQSQKRSASRALAPGLESVISGTGADVDQLRRVSPLPETTDELCAVARNLNAPAGSVYLGERATVSQIKALSASGALGRARTVHFATHGLLANETALFAHGRAEPALLLTPPARDKASAEDDGLLKPSDVTGLKLNADWVVMSACNTAGGDEGGEALSGLAKSFFYAGARSLLVSHWYVDSEAAVEITTGAFSALKSDPAIGRDEALRRSLAALIAKGGDNAHPSVWAPFVLVGDGGRTAALQGVERMHSEALAKERKASGEGAPASATRTLKLEGVGGKTISGLTFSPDGGQLLGATPNSAVMVWDARTGAVRKLTSGGAEKIFGFSADGRLLAAFSGSRSTIALWDARQSKPAGSINAGEGVRFSHDAAALSPDGKRLAVEQYGASSSPAPAIGVWDTGSGKLIRLLQSHVGDVHALVFSPNGGRLAVIDDKGALSLWDAETGKPAFPVIASASAKLAAFSPDGRVLASAGAGGEVALWDARTGRRAGGVVSQGEKVHSLAFSPDGRLLAIGHTDGVVELRETSSLAISVSSDQR